MLRRLVRWLVALPRRRSDDEASGYAGSLLDASVNYAHGQDDGRDGAKAIQNVNEKASKLQDADDHRR